MTVRAPELGAHAAPPASASHALGALDDERAPAVQHRARLRAGALRAARAAARETGSGDLTARAAALCDGERAPVRR